MSTIENNIDDILLISKIVCIVQLCDLIIAGVDTIRYMLKPGHVELYILIIIIDMLYLLFEGWVYNNTMLYVNQLFITTKSTGNSSMLLDESKDKKNKYLYVLLLGVILMICTLVLSFMI